MGIAVDHVSQWITSKLLHGKRRYRWTARRATAAWSVISLYQSNLAALRVTAWRNWERRNDAAVAVLDSVHW